MASKKPIWNGRPSSSTPGMRVRPSTLTEKMATSTINGARIRRRIRKIVSEARLAEAAAASSRARRARRSSSSRRPRRAQNVSRGLPTAASGSPAVEGDGLNQQQDDGDEVGQQGAPGQGHDARRPALRHAGRRDVLGVAVHQRRPDQLQDRDDAGGQVDGADLGAVAELQHEGDEVDDHRGEQLVGVVQVGVAHVAEEEAEVQRRGEQDEEPEDDLLQVHAVLPPAAPAARGSEHSIAAAARPRYGRCNSGRSTRSTRSSTTVPSSGRPVTSQRSASTAGPTSAAIDRPTSAGTSPRASARATNVSQAASQLAKGRRRHPSCSTGSSTTAPSRLRSARPEAPPKSATTSVRTATRSSRSFPVSGTAGTGAPTTSRTPSSSSALVDQRR